MIERKMPWIVDSGESKIQEIQEILDRMTVGSADDTPYALAYFTDGCQKGPAEALLRDMAWDRLLELRIFNEDRELLLRRTGSGSPFSWRLASEEKAGEEYCFETRQLLEQPLSEEKRWLRVMNYIAYDEDGAAYAADHRLIGFAGEGIENADRNQPI